MGVFPRSTIDDRFTIVGGTDADFVLDSMLEEAPNDAIGPETETLKAAWLNPETGLCLGRWDDRRNQ